MEGDFALRPSREEFEQLFATFTQRSGRALRMNSPTNVRPVRFWIPNWNTGKTAIIAQILEDWLGTSQRAPRTADDAMSEASTTAAPSSDDDDYDSDDVQYEDVD